MKKIFSFLVILVLLFSCLVLPISAFSWSDISPRDLVDEIGDTYYSKVVNNLDNNLKTNLYTEPYDVYIRIYMGVQNNFPLLTDTRDLPLQSITESPYAEPIYKDVTTLLSFGVGNSLKPTNVYMGNVAGSGWQLDITPNDDVVFDSQFYNYDGSFPSNYQIEKNYYLSRIEFVLKYTVDPSRVVSTTGSPLSFYDAYNIIDFTPMLIKHAPANFEVSVSVRDIYCIMNSSVVAEYIDGVPMNTYHVITSTNIFTPYDIVTKLFLFSKDGFMYGYGKSSTWELEVATSATHNNTTRFISYKVFDYGIPYQNISNNTQYGKYIDNQCHFVNDDTYLYGIHIDGKALKWGEVKDPLNNTQAPKTTYYCGYQYKCNTIDLCSAFRFSMTLFISHEEEFSPLIVQGDNNINGDIDISQFYKSVNPRFSLEDGLLEGLQDFFSSLFTDTLPNILNNFVVWFMCESPLISTITKPIFLLAHLTVGYTISWVVPFLTSLGLFGGIVFVIFLAKRLLPHLIGSD